MFFRDSLLEVLTLRAENCNVMTQTRALQWRKIPVNLAELCLDTTLRCGQSFRYIVRLSYPTLLHTDHESRWRKSEDDVWSCALHGRILSLRQDLTHLYYRAIFPRKAQAPLTPPSSARSLTPVSFLEDDDTEALVYHYLNLVPQLTELYEQWSAADLNFKKRAPEFTGVRILKQDAWEALVGFICSSNNNIIRISQMVRWSDQI